MADKKDLDIVSYILGIISIVMAFISSYGLGGIIFGIIGIFYSKKQKTDLSRRAKKLSIIGLVIGIILFVFSLVATIYFTINGIESLQNFPV
jgi:predicted small integral membrane protein